MLYHGKSYPDDVKCIHLHHAIIVNVMNNGQIIPFVYHLIICLQGTNWTSELLLPALTVIWASVSAPPVAVIHPLGILATALWCAHCTQPATTAGRGVYICQLFIKFAGELKDIGIIFRDEHDPLPVLWFLGWIMSKRKQMQLQGVVVIIMQSLMLVTFGMENKFYEMLVKEGIQCTACQIL